MTSWYPANRQEQVSKRFLERDDVETKRGLTALTAMLMASVITLQGCNKSDSSLEGTVRRAILSEAKNGANAVPIADVAPFKWGFVCALAPYQDRIPADAVEAERVNPELRRMSFLGGEDSWALIFIERGDATVLKIRRGSDLDFMAPNRARELKLGTGQTSMESVSCARRNVAVLKPITVKEQLFVTFGEEK